jgi:hypothetical protein
LGAIVLAGWMVIVPFVAPASARSHGKAPASSTSTTAKPAKTQSAPADHFILWIDWRQCADLSDAALGQWAARGAGGFVCETQYLAGMGGSQQFTADPSADFTAPQYLDEQAIRTANVVSRARSHGLSMYLGFYMVNFENIQTPLAVWFDDATWTNTVLPDLRNLSGAAKFLGFAGVAIDQELYPQTGQHYTATWDWDYPGNTHPRAATEAEVVQRGKQVMQALLQGFPGVNIVVYDTLFPDTWDARVQQVENGVNDPYGDSVQLDFWNGMTSVDGYGTTLLLDATFYKEPSISGASWTAALQYQDNSLYSLLSQRLSNWAYASTHVAQSPFAWIDGDVAHEGPYAAVRSPSYVGQQLAAFHQWAMSGMFGLYAYNQLSAFDYSPFVPALKAATSPSVPNVHPPTVVADNSQRSVSTTPDGRPQVRLGGYATDPLAIRVVSWRNESLHADGAATMVWEMGAGNDAAGWHWRMNWTATVPLGSGANRIAITAQSIDGRSTTKTVTITK